MVRTPSLARSLALAGVDLPHSYPRDLVLLVPLQLPIAFVPMRNFETAMLERWLDRRQISCNPVAPCRRLHGALVARAGRGLIFIDSSDDPAEQRFTSAHETAHFIDDHLIPRLEALKALGEVIRPVLDGEREPTSSESLSAILNRVPLGVQVHLMARSSDGAIRTWDVEEREQRADRMALELMAPTEAALRELRQALSSAGAGWEAEQAGEILAKRFGLPTSAARAYAGLLLAKQGSRPKLSHALLGGSR